MSFGSRSCCPCPVEELYNVDLAAGGGQCVEIEIVDMDVAILVGFREPGIENVQFVELLCTLGAVFEHRTHSGIPVDVGIFALDVAVQRALEREILKGAHELGVHLAYLGPFGAIKDVFLGGAGMAVLYENTLHKILDVLHVRCLTGLRRVFFGKLSDLAGECHRLVVIAAAYRLCRAKDRVGNLFQIKRNLTSVPLADFCDHIQSLPSFQGTIHVFSCLFPRSVLRGWSMVKRDGARDMPCFYPIKTPQHIVVLRFYVSLRCILYPLWAVLSRRTSK